MRYYFDNAAATPVASEVLQEMERFWSIDYGNPSAIHKEGLAARAAIDDARSRIAKIIGGREEGITLTSSATESINLAITGAVLAWKRNHPDEIPEIVISSIEHDAVLETADRLRREGAIVKTIPVNDKGIVEVAKVAELLGDRTVVVSCMMVNNEVGTIQPIEEIARVIRKWKKDHKGITRDRSPTSEDVYPLLHTDATQAVNYLEINIPRLGVDMLSCNASKIYGPKGVGLLYRSPLVMIDPIIVGGGQESGLRAGTEPVPLIAGFAKAFEMAQLTGADETARLLPLQKMLFEHIAEVASEAGVGVVINGDLDERAPNNVHVSFIGVDHEYLTILLDDAGFAVSTKSACNMLLAETSHVLLAIKNATNDDADICRLETGLRITLGRHTDMSSCDAFVKTLREVLPLSVVQ